MRFGKSSISALLPGAVLITLSLYALPVQAQLVLQTSRAGLSGTDSVDWSTAGAEFSNPSNPFTIMSTMGDTLTVSEASNTFERRNQSTGWAGNFASGDALLWTGGSNGPVTITFGTPVSGAGAQIMSDFFGAFTAEIDAYDSSNMLLGTVTENGVSNSNDDNSAIFIGAQDLATPIAKMVFSLSFASNQPTDFAINRLDLTTAAPMSTPEPGSVAMLVGMGLSGAGFLARRRNQTGKAA